MSWKKIKVNKQKELSVNLTSQPWVEILPVKE